MKTADQQIIQRLNEIYDARGGGSGAVNWGAILGTLANQTDLATALGLKQTAAQVQALIDAKGIIGKIGFHYDGVDLVEDFQSGVISAATRDALGIYTFTIAQPDNRYLVEVNALTSSAGIPATWSMSAKSNTSLTISLFIQTSSITSGTPSEITDSVIQVFILR